MELGIVSPEFGPIRKKILSTPILIKSFSNKYVDNEVRVSIVFPKGYKLEVAETSADKAPKAAGGPGVIKAGEYEIYSTIFSSKKLGGIPSDFVVLEKETLPEKVSGTAGGTPMPR